MAGTDIYTSYLMQKGPLTDEESTLKDLLLRDQIYKYQPQKLFGTLSVQAAPSVSATPSPAPSSGGNTPPIVATHSSFNGSMLGYVSPGELITANFMNNVVDAVNEIIDYLERAQYGYVSNPTQVLSATAAPQSPGIAGIIKDVATDTGSDNIVTVKIPGQSLKPEDFDALVYGNRRINPADLVKTDDGLSFKINKSDIGTDTPDLLAVAKGASNQQVLQLFR